MGVMVNRPPSTPWARCSGRWASPARTRHCRPKWCCPAARCIRSRGFVLHDGDHAFDSSLEVADGLYLTTSRDVLEAMARGDGPPQALVALGCAGWGEGQLEQELVDDSWLLVPNRTDVLFQLPIAQRWQAAAGASASICSTTPATADTHERSRRRAADPFRRHRAGLRRGHAPDRGGGGQRHDRRRARGGGGGRARCRPRVGAGGAAAARVAARWPGGRRSDDPGRRRPADPQRRPRVRARTPPAHAFGQW